VTLPLPRALLFDWDNTLVDTWTVIHHALNRTFAEMGHRPWTLDETRRRVRASARDSFPLIFGERAEEAAELFYRIFEADHLAKLRARAGAADLLAGLAARGDLYLAVVSNKRGHILRREAAHLGWDRFFSRLVVGGVRHRRGPGGLVRRRHRYRHGLRRQYRVPAGAAARRPAGGGRVRSGRAADPRLRLRGAAGFGSPNVILLCS